MQRQQDDNMNPQQATLFYIHDPMCSWCWGFKPVWVKLQNLLPGDINIKYVLGGLAADSDQPMPVEMQQFLQQTWKNIQRHIPGTVFNFDFWSQCLPRRSTYASCRAVIATKQQNPALETEIILKIQQAYYLEAKNPSDDATLIALASELGLNTDQFMHDLNSAATQQQLQKEIQLSGQLGAQGFPSIVLATGHQMHFINIDYLQAVPMLEQIKDLLTK